MKVCFFGSYESEKYTKILKKIVLGQKIEVIECHEEINGFISLVKAYVKLFQKHRSMNYDVMIIPWRGIITLPLAKIISKGPIIYFPFLSIHDVLVLERKILKTNSIKASLIFFADKMACKLADMIILDSDSHIEHFLKKFNLSRKKFRTLFLGTDEDEFPLLSIKKVQTKFIVLYFGSFIPPHGIEIILKCASILKENENIVFRFCGDGPLKNEMIKLAKSLQLTNCEFLGHVSKEILNKNIKNSDICLGAFGTSAKALEATFMKTYAIFSSQKPLITVESEGMKTTYGVNDKNCILIPSDPKKMSKKILELMNNPKKIEEIAIEGRKTYEKYFTTEKIGKKLVEYINEVLLNNKK